MLTKKGNNLYIKRNVWGNTFLEPWFDRESYQISLTASTTCKDISALWDNFPTQTWYVSTCKFRAIQKENWKFLNVSLLLWVLIRIKRFLKLKSLKVKTILINRTSFGYTKLKCVQVRCFLNSIMPTAYNYVPM